MNVRVRAKVSCVLSVQTDYTMMYINVCMQATIDSFLGNMHTMVAIMVDV